MFHAQSFFAQFLPDVLTQQNKYYCILSLKKFMQIRCILNDYLYYEELTFKFTDCRYRIIGTPVYRDKSVSSLGMLEEHSGGKKQLNQLCIERQEIKLLILRT